MERGSDKHGPRKDDALAEDVEGMIRGTGPTHAEEWKDPEPPADDDPPADPGRIDIAGQTGASDEVDARE